MDSLMTQEELAEKYETDQGTISQALSMAGVFKKETQINGRSRKRLYDEREAVEALTALLWQRQKRTQDQADDYLRRIQRVHLIFEEGKPDGTVEHG